MELPNKISKILQWNKKVLDKSLWYLTKGYLCLIILWQSTLIKNKIWIIKSKTNCPDQLQSKARFNLAITLRKLVLLSILDPKLFLLRSKEVWWTALIKQKTQVRNLFTKTRKLAISLPKMAKKSKLSTQNKLQQLLFWTRTQRHQVEAKVLKLDNNTDKTPLKDNKLVKMT